MRMRLFSICVLVTALRMQSIEGEHLRGRKLKDSSCGTLIGCYLVNSSTMSEIELTGDDTYCSKDSKRGWTVRCDTDYGETRTLDFIEFIYDDEVHNEFREPRYMNGDSGGDPIWLNQVRYLSSPGDKHIEVKGRQWSKTCYEKDYTLRNNCDLGENESSLLSDEPSSMPLAAQTDVPIAAPTDALIAAPTDALIAAPTDAPIAAPTDAPIAVPTDAPIAAPTDAPIDAPTDAPIISPTNTPTETPSDTPSDTPSNTPTVPPTLAPTSTPTVAPTDAPTVAPTDAPIIAPTDAPAVVTTDSPIVAPTDKPTATSFDKENGPDVQTTFSEVEVVESTTNPTVSPSANPTESGIAKTPIQDSKVPTLAPSSAPSPSPSSSPFVSPTDSYPTPSPSSNADTNPISSPTSSIALDSQVPTPGFHAAPSPGNSTVELWPLHPPVISRCYLWSSTIRFYSYLPPNSRVETKTSHGKYFSYTSVDGMDYIKDPNYRQYDSSAFYLRIVYPNGETGFWKKCVNYTPIGLDIDRNGAVEHIHGNFVIDITGDGTTESLEEWFAPSEGILIDTSHGTESGIITGHHLFGDMGRRYVDGFEKLALLDINEDSEVSGDELEGLAIWIDANSNALLDDGELTSLESHGIVSLSTIHDDFKSTATLSDGSEMVMEDKWFVR